MRQEGAPTTPVSGSTPGGQEVLSVGKGQGEVMNKGDRGIIVSGNFYEAIQRAGESPPGPITIRPGQHSYR